EKFARPGEQPKQIAPDTMQVLLNHAWPGNVRELENAMERACVTTRTERIEADTLPQDVLTPPKTKSPFRIDLDKPLTTLVKEIVAQVENQYIRKALKKTHGHVGRCARICGLSRRSITSKIAEYQLDKSVFKDSDEEARRPA